MIKQNFHVEQCRTTAFRNWCITRSEKVLGAQPLPTVTRRSIQAILTVATAVDRAIAAAAVY